MKYHHWTPLHIASQCGKTDVKYLASKVANKNTQ